VKTSLYACVYANDNGNDNNETEDNANAKA